MHLLAGVVPLSHRRAIALARRYSSFWSDPGLREKVLSLMSFCLAHISDVYERAEWYETVARNINWSALRNAIVHMPTSDSREFVRYFLRHVFHRVFSRHTFQVRTMSSLRERCWVSVVFEGDPWYPLNYRTNCAGTIILLLPAIIGSNFRDADGETDMSLLKIRSW